jgi:hypothetical protein
MRSTNTLTSLESRDAGDGFVRGKVMPARFTHGSSSSAEEERTYFDLGDT